MGSGAALPGLARRPQASRPVPHPTTSHPTNPQVSLNVAPPGEAGDAAGGGGGADAGKKLPGDSFSVQLGWDGKAAREWWTRFVFGKTYVERRSIFTMFR